MGSERGYMGPAFAQLLGSVFAHVPYFSGKIVPDPREVLKEFKQGIFFGKRNGSKFNQINSVKKSFEWLKGKEEEKSWA